MKIDISAAVVKLWKHTSVLPYNDQPCIINLITMAARTHKIIMFCLRDQFYFLWKIGGLKNATVVWLCASMYLLFFFGFVVLLYFFYWDQVWCLTFSKLLFLRFKNVENKSFIISQTYVRLPAHEVGLFFCQLLLKTHYSIYIWASSNDAGVAFSILLVYATAPQFKRHCP